MVPEKNTNKQEVVLPESEFTLYERLCNERNSAVRKSGILDETIYQEVMEDDSTIKIMHGTRPLPVLVDIRHGLGAGYDVERARQLAGSGDTVRVLVMPLGDIDQSLQTEVAEAIAGSGAGAVFFADNEARDSAVLYEGLRHRGIDFREIPLLDERASPEHQRAALSLYSIDVLPTEPAEGEESRPKKLHDILEYFNQEKFPLIEDLANSVLLRSGHDFSEAELDEVWQLYVDRFQFLGQQHPISMEDTKEDFLKLFTQPDTVVAIKYVEGKPVCFTYFLEDFEKLYWLNAEYFKTDYETADALQMPVFFPGIVASKETRGNNASEVINVFAEAVAQIGAGCRIYFENTNFSEQYIPKIIYRAASGRPEYRLSEPAKIDQTEYRLIQIYPNAA